MTLGVALMITASMGFVVGSIVTSVAFWVVLRD
jgi:hypothetical protein